MLETNLINFTNLSFDERKMILEWRNHNSIRQWMFSQEIIALENHLNYIESLQQREDRIYFLVNDENSNPVGVIDFTNISTDKADIGLYAKPNVKGIGKFLMQSIIHYGFNKLKVATLISEVYENNQSAIRLYKKFNFKIIDQRENILVMELKNENR